MVSAAPSRRRMAGALLASVLGFGVVAAIGAPAGAVADVSTSRLAGTDRFRTAADVARAAYPSGATTVLIANGRAFPDALAGAALAGDRGAPLLLTERDTLPPATVQAIDDLNATTAIVLGGTAAVSTAVADQLDRDLAVTRVAGADRYETAAEIAEAVGAADIGATNGRRTALIATGLDFADALAGGPVAAGNNTGELPILLTNAGVPAATKQALADLAIKQVIILGGTVAVPAAVETELEQLTGNDAVRLAGADRYATATAVATEAVKSHGFSAKQVLLANGRAFPDALAGGPVGGVRKAPLVLTELDSLPAPTRTYLEGTSQVVEQVVALGGTAVISDATLAAAEKAAEARPKERANEALVVTPQDTAFLPNNGQGTRTYTVNDLGTRQVDIALVDCANVTTAANGDTTFVNTNANTLLDGTAREGSAPDRAETPATISSVNGTPRTSAEANNDHADDVSAASNGTLTFQVTGPSSGTACVTPVVYIDANSDDALNGGTTNPATPTEVFGTGGDADFGPAQGTAGTFNRSNVTTSDDASNRIVACPVSSNGPPEVASTSCVTYFYDAGDTFQLNSVATTLAEFERVLSAGDDISGSYAPGGVSTFNLIEDEAPVAPTTVNAAPEASDSTAIAVSFSDSSTTTNDSYNVYRAPGVISGSSPNQVCSPSEQYRLVGTVTDTGSPTPPALNWTFVDRTTAANTTYCYRVAGVDDGDEGPMSAATGATSGSGANSAPTITSAQGSSADTTVGAGDVHELVFSEALAPGTATTASYSVRDADGTVGTINCGTASPNAVCAVDGARFRARLTADPVAGAAGTTAGLVYPATITATTGFTDTDGASADLANSADKVIEQSTLTSDTTAPFITTAKLVNASGNGGQWDASGDRLELKFSEAIVERYANDSSLSEADVEAITGRDVDYGLLTTVALTKPTVDTLVLTIGGATPMDTGLGLGGTVDGSHNRNVVDALLNPQQPNPTTDPTLTT